MLCRLLALSRKGEPILKYSPNIIYLCCRMGFACQGIYHRVIKLTNLIKCNKKSVHLQRKYTFYVTSFSQTVKKLSSEPSPLNT